MFPSEDMKIGWLEARLWCGNLDVMKLIRHAELPATVIGTKQKN
jgi:hypothetical protein